MAMQTSFTSSMFTGEFWLLYLVSLHEMIDYFCKVVCFWWALHRKQIHWIHCCLHWVLCRDMLELLLHCALSRRLYASHRLRCSLDGHKKDMWAILECKRVGVAFSCKCTILYMGLSIYCVFKFLVRRKVRHGRIIPPNHTSESYLESYPRIIPPNHTTESHPTPYYC